MPVLGYLPKLKRGLELVFGAHFLHGFFMQMLLINTLSIDKVSKLFFFPSQDIKQNLLLSSYLDN